MFVNMECVSHSSVLMCRNAGQQSRGWSRYFEKSETALCITTEITGMVWYRPGQDRTHGTVTVYCRGLVKVKCRNTGWKYAQTPPGSRLLGRDEGRGKYPWLCNELQLFHPGLFYKILLLLQLIDSRLKHVCVILLHVGKYNFPFQF